MSALEMLRAIIRAEAQGEPSLSVSGNERNEINEETLLSDRVISFNSFLSSSDIGAEQTALSWSEPASPDPDMDNDAHGLGVPTLLRDGRRLHRFRAESVPQRAAYPVQGLMDEAQSRRAVLVADGHELIVVEARSFALDIDTLIKLKLEAGSIIAVLRSESRKRTAAAPTEAAEPS